MKRTNYHSTFISFIKQFLIVVCLTTLACCRNEKLLIVNVAFTDSVLSNYTIPSEIKSNDAELLFWKNRINPHNPGIVNELKYAATLMRRFHYTGDIQDVETADSILRKTDTLFKYREAAPNLSLVSHYLLQHRFNEASTTLQKARTIGLKKYDLYAVSFDVDLETGNYLEANSNLYSIRAENDYGYNFRQSKWQHYKGNMDSAISAMNKAIELSGNDVSLRQAALSNTADLYLHNGELEKANQLYMQSIKLSAADLHSMMGIGWIALVHDKNIATAEKIFQFVQTKTLSPDALFKMIQVEAAKHDSIKARRLANEFVHKVNNSLYGNMYNKYLIDLYTGILNDPAKAEQVAVKELNNRNTPQCYAWYVYALYKNGKPDQAFKLYQQYVAGKPLESLESYWIGKMMLGIKKGYNAKNYLEEAYNNRYDLDLKKINDIEKIVGKWE
jgi:hypothetical protein